MSPTSNQTESSTIIHTFDHSRLEWTNSPYIWRTLSFHLRARLVHGSRSGCMILCPEEHLSNGCKCSVYLRHARLRALLRLLQGATASTLSSYDQGKLYGPTPWWWWFSSTPQFWWPDTPSPPLEFALGRYRSSPSAQTKYSWWEPFGVLKVCLKVNLEV